MPIDTPDWVRDAVFYQIFPDRFASSPRLAKPGPLEPWDSPPTLYGFKGGDLLGIVDRLPYLEALGINALYLTPVFASASNHRYHTFDYFEVDPLLGGTEALRVLLDEAHGHGIRVVLDGVFNHTGRGFWAFHHVLETGAASPYRHWFHFDQQALDEGRPILAYPGSHQRAGVAVDEPGLGAGSPARDGRWSLDHLGYQAWWDLPALPKLNTDDPGVREHLLSVAEHWIKFGIDGWRLDVPEEIADASFWREFRVRVRSVNPEAYLVGEIWRIAPDWVSGDPFDATMNYPLGQAILSFAGAGHLDLAVIGRHAEYARAVRPEDAPTFARRLDEVVSAYAPETAAVQLNLLGSHDTPRVLTLLGRDRAAYRLGVLLQATLPGAPCIYYGDEVGLEGDQDPDCRRAFPPDERWDREVLEFVRAVMALRHAQRALRRGSCRVLAAAGSVIAFERVLEGESAIVAVNAGDQAAAVRIDLGPEASAARLAPLPLPVWEAPASARSDDGSVEVRLPARSGAVWRLEEHGRGR